MREALPAADDSSRLVVALSCPRALGERLEALSLRVSNAARCSLRASPSADTPLRPYTPVYFAREPAVSRPTHAHSDAPLRRRRRPAARRPQRRLPALSHLPPLASRANPTLSFTAFFVFWFFFYFLFLLFRHRSSTNVNAVGRSGLTLPDALAGDVLSDLFGGYFGLFFLNSFLLYRRRSSANVNTIG